MSIVDAGFNKLRWDVGSNIWGQGFWKSQRGMLIGGVGKGSLLLDLKVWGAVSGMHGVDQDWYLIYLFDLLRILGCVDQFLALIIEQD